jgi:hypothetical protein
MYEDGLKSYSIGRGHIPPVEFSGITTPDERLQSITELYIKNSIRPIPIFPDIMAEPDVKSVKKAWYQKQSDGFNFSEIAECPYVHLAYGHTVPEFNQDDIDSMFNAIYSDLVTKKSDKK